METVKMHQATAFRVRWAIRSDMEQILQIEKARNSDRPSPWTHDEIIRNLRERNCIGMVATVKLELADHTFKEMVVGFMLYKLFPTHIRLCELTVYPFFRRSLAGTQMLERVKSKLTQHRRHTLLVDVRDDNTTAQFFLRKLGFRATQVFRGYFNDGSCAYRMAYTVKS